MKALHVIKWGTIPCGTKKVVCLPSIREIHLVEVGGFPHLGRIFEVVRVYSSGHCNGCRGGERGGWDEEETFASLPIPPGDVRASVIPTRIITPVSDSPWRAPNTIKYAYASYKCFAGGGTILASTRDS